MARPWSLETSPLPHAARHLSTILPHPARTLERDPQSPARPWPLVRVDAEVVQDIALKASGPLSPKIGGPSVSPLPDGVMSLAYGPIP